jgi:hypothetical protein
VNLKEGKRGYRFAAEMALSCHCLARNNGVNAALTTAESHLFG